MKTSEMLIKAKALLSRTYQETDYKFRYICNAITSSCDNTASSNAKRIMLLDEISRRLEICLTLEQWLLKKHGIAQKYNMAYLDKVQETRHAWIDSMIAEFQSKRD